MVWTPVAHWLSSSARANAWLASRTGSRQGAGRNGRAARLRPIGARAGTPRGFSTGAKAVCQGVSLLEVLVVVGIIALASVLAAAAMGGGFEGIQLRGSAKEIAANLRFTRSRAIATGQPQTFTINPRAHTWQAPDGRDGEVPENLGIVFTGAREVQPREEEGAIMFFADGAATGGRVQLQAQARRGARRAAWNVDVAWLTGEVTLERSEAP